MPAEQEPFPEKNRKTGYFVDTESAAEMARLLRQDQLLNAGMGGVLPEQGDLSEIQRVLDLACGSGGWALEVAYTYSDMEVVGVDISERMVAYAQSQAAVQQRYNVEFHVMDILKPLDFPPASFDLVNARLIGGFVKGEYWPVFFSECSRILRPGGIVRLTEAEIGASNKYHFERTWQRIFQALKRADLNASATGDFEGFTHVMPYLFKQAGLTVLGKRAHAIDISFGGEAHEGFYHDLSMMFQLLEPSMVTLNIAKLEEWRDLYHKCLAEMCEEDFCSILYMLTVWGRKAL